MRRLRISASIAAVIFVTLTAAMVLRASLPNLSTGSWGTAGVMQQARTDAAATVLEDGQVLVSGGVSSAGTLSSAEIYDGNGNFSSAAPMNEGRSAHAAARLEDGRVLVTGGYTSGGGITNSAEIYDPWNDTWTAAGNMLSARAGHTATALPDGRIAIIGGDSSSGPVSSIEIYDPQSGKFSAAGSLVTGRKNHAAALLANGDVLVAGGMDADGNYLSSVEQFDPDGTGIHAAASMSQARAKFTATTVIDGLVFVAGGETAGAPDANGNPTTVELSNGELYAPGVDSWATVPMQSARSGHVALLLPNNNSVMIAGGSANGAPIANVELFQSWLGKSSATGSMNAARSGAFGAGLSREGYAMVAGGNDSTTAEAYRFATIKTDYPDYSPGIPVKMTGTGWTPGETVALHVHEDVNDTITDLPDFYSIADANGNIAYTDYAPSVSDYGAKYHLTAIGQTSGREAQTLFTDGNVQSVIAFAVQGVSAPNGTNPVVTVGVNSSVSWSMAATCNTQGSNTCPASNPDGSPVPNGYSFQLERSTQSNFNQNLIVVTSGSTSGGTGSASGSFTAPATAGTYFFRINHKDDQNISSDNWKKVASATFTLTVNADSTPPVITPNITGTLGSNGWYTSDVSLTWTVTDAESTVSSSTGCGASSVTTDTTGITFTCSATSAGGSNSQSVTIKRDATAPTAALSVTAGTVGSNGWYVTNNVTIHTAGTAGLSGVASCSADQSQTSETTGATFNGSCTNGAGVVANAAPLTVKLDKSAPSATLAVSAGTLGSNGWYTSDVTVHASGTDSISSPVTCTADQSLTTNSAGTTFNATCTNDAGLSASAAALTVKLDKVAPTAALSITAGNAGTNGWYTSDVTIHTTCTAGLSGFTQPADQSLSTESTGTTFNGSCTNGAGVVANAPALVVKLDKTGPSANLAVSSGTLGDNGWYVSNVVLHASGADAISSPVSCTADQNLNVDSTGTVFHATCTNDAGLSTNATDLNVKRDATAPSVNASADRAANAAGWYNAAVSVSFNGTDSTSGIASCDSAKSYSAPDSSSASVSGQCKDNAGNIGSGSLNLKYDATAPSISLTSRLPAANANGWNNTDVTVVWACTDATSGPVSASDSKTASAEGASISLTGSCADVAGNSSTATQDGIKIDKTAPSISASRAPSANANGWNNVDVTASYTASDALSGLAAGAESGSHLFNTEGANQSTTFTVTDLAGNSASAPITNVNIDKTAPIAALAATRAADHNGWYNHALGFSTAGSSDALSGLDSCSVVNQYSGPDSAAAQVSTTCTDLAGNSAGKSLDFKYDGTAPSLTGSRSPAANDFGWNNVNVTASFDCSDNLSGVESKTGDTEVSAEGANQHVDGSCSDNAGNSSNASVTGISIDKSAPSISAARLTAANVHGWNNGDVDSSYSASDSLSGLVEAASGNFLFTSEGANQSHTFTVHDKAGNSASASVSGVNIDLTAPSVNATPDSSPNASGWYKSAVSVSFSGSDSLSGVAGCDAAKSYSGPDSASTSVSGDCTDNAGNVGHASFALKFDATAPQITFVNRTAPNGAGWNNSDVTVNWSCSDATSGPVSPSASDVLSSEGASLSAHGTCSDLAGNSASDTVSGIKIDKTAPSFSASRSPEANAFGWNNSDVTVSFSCSDSLSGVGASSGPQLFSAEGANQAASGSCTDVAGNEATAGVSNISIDKTAPSISAQRDTAANAHGWNNGDVASSYSASDGLSGLVDPASGGFTFSSEGAGQSHQFTVTDKAGNSASSTVAGVSIDKTAPVINASRLPAANSYGWNNTDVTASYTASDALSGLNGAASGSHLFSVEGAGQSTSFSVTDLAGNSASATISDVNIDKTAPTISSQRDTAANAHLWNNGDVASSYSASDSLSGLVDPASGGFTFSSEGANQSHQFTVSDKAGNSASSTVAGVNIDKTAPVAHIDADRATDHDGWYNHAVSFSTAASTDALSGIDSCSSVGSYSGPDTASTSVSTTCQDVAGNSADATLPFKYDASAPINVLLSASTPGGQNGWYIADASVTTSGDDSISGVSCTAPQTISTEGAAVAVAGSCTNGAGLTTNATPLSLKIDKTTPTAALSVSAGTPGANGWYISDVNIHTAGTAGASGVASCTADQQQTAETTGVSFNGSCSNGAGVTANATPLAIKLDKTGPSASLTPLGTLGNNGWYISNVSVSTSGSDSVASPVVCTAVQSVNSDTTGQLVAGSCTNDAGISTNAASITIKRDATKPVVTPSITPGTALILNGSASSSAGASDATSGLAGGTVTCSALDLSSVGSKSMTCNATDNAGNSNSALLSYTVSYLTGGACLGDLNHSILQPINAPNSGLITSVFKNGSVIPVKFRVCDARGVSLGTAGVAQGLFNVGMVGGTPTDVNESVYSNTPDSTFRWDASAQQWIFNLSTKGNTLQTGATYNFEIRLNDGSKIPFLFGLK